MKKPLPKIILPAFFCMLAIAKTFSQDGKNILNDRSREFFKSGAVPLMLPGGINYEF